MSVVQPAVVVAMAASRMRDVSEALSRKLDATTVQASLGNGRIGLGPNRFRPTERRVLALVRAASDMLHSPEPAAVARSGALYPGPSRYAVLGSAGFELPAYADLLAVTHTWRAATMRRGTPDPFLSLVEVPTATFVNRVGTEMLADAGADAAAIRRAEAFTMGVVGALAHGLVMPPIQRAAHARRTSKPWNRHEPAAFIRSTDAATLRRVVGGADPVATFQAMWPSAEQAAPLLAGYHRALDAVYHLEDRPARARGWPAYEDAFVAGPALDEARLRAGYERLLADLEPWGMGAWFGVLTPILLGPGLALLAGRALPGASAFMTADSVTERSLSELITVSDGIGSIAPFVYSMVMWANVADQPSEPFVSALWTFIVRAGLFAGWIPTIGTSTDDPSPAARWALAGGMLGIDVYALVRLLASLGDRQPGPAVAFGVQNIPGVMTLVTLGQAGIVKGVVAAAAEAGADDDGAAIAGWIAWAVTTLGLWLGAGLPVAAALARGGGWMSWFHADGRPSWRGALAEIDQPVDAQDAGAVFDDSALWHDPATAAPGLTDLRYPTGGRPLVKVWRAEGSPALEISHDLHTISIRDAESPAAVTRVEIGPGSRTVDDVVALLADVDHIEAAAADAGVRYDLPWPASIANPGDGADPRQAVDDPARTAFTELPTDPDEAYVIRHAPDSSLTSPIGQAGPARSPFDGLRVVPRERLGDLDDTGLGVATDLAVLLGLGAASRLRTVQPLTPAVVPAVPAVPGPIGAVAQVFRDWNLDHRRANEWRTIVAGGASAEQPPPADAALAEGARIADAMGWVALWRAWLRVASDTLQDTESALVSPDTPAVRAADGTELRPTNAQLTRGICYLLDLPT